MSPSFNCLINIKKVTICKKRGDKNVNVSKKVLPLWALMIVGTIEIRYTFIILYYNITDNIVIYARYRKL